MKLFVVRHGQSAWNLARKICGMTDLPLTEEGWRQAREVASRLKEAQEENDIRHIVVSGLLRARQTASCIEAALGIEAVVDERFHEIDFGRYEGIPFEDPRYVARRSDPFMRFPGGESLADVAARVYPALDDLKRTYAPDNVLLVCHGAMSKVVATYFASYSHEAFGSLHIANCSVRVFDLDAERT